MTLPAIILLLLVASSFGVAAAKHGEPRGDYNFGESLVSCIILLGLLYWGGFFHG